MTAARTRGPEAQAWSLFSGYIRYPPNALKDEEMAALKPRRAW
jgi:hypothetical protein